MGQMYAFMLNKIDFPKLQPFVNVLFLIQFIIMVLISWTGFSNLYPYLGAGLIHHLLKPIAYNVLILFAPFGFYFVINLKFQISFLKRDGQEIKITPDVVFVQFSCLIFQMKVIFDFIFKHFEFKN